VQPCLHDAPPWFFLAIVYPIGHNTAVPRKRSQSPGSAPERLTALYTQLQGVIPLLQDIIQAGTVEEGAGDYALGSVPSSNTGPRYRFEKRGKASWALLALTKYKKGAATLIERLEAYERAMAHLAAIQATPHQLQPGESSAVPAPP
jgi:hypothetical protein